MLTVKEIVNGTKGRETILFKVKKSLTAQLLSVILELSKINERYSCFTELTAFSQVGSFILVGNCPSMKASLLLVSPSLDLPEKQKPDSFHTQTFNSEH